MKSNQIPMEELKIAMLSPKALAQEKHERKLCEEAYAKGVWSERKKWIDACIKSEQVSNGMLEPTKLFDILGMKWEDNN
jgi:hypothetical protein